MSLNSENLKEWKIYALKLKDSDYIRYIGQTCAKLDIRLCEHKSHSNRGKYKNAYWVKKHKDNIEIILLEDGIYSLDMANKKESEYIKLYKSFGAELNNLTDGGGGTEGIKFTDEHRRKLSEARKGKSPWNKGNKNHKSELKCSYCSKDFTIYENIKKRTSQKTTFCSRTCSTKHQVKNKHGVFSISRNKNGQYSGFTEKII